MTKKEEIIIAMTIGDGHLRMNKRGKNASFEIEHSTKQKEYLLYKKKILEKILKIKGKTYENNKKNSIRVSFKTNILFTNIYNKMYIDKKKTLINIIDVFSETMFVFLFLDDGTAKTKKTKKGIFIDQFAFSTNCFSFEECKLLKNKIEELWGIKANVATDRGQPRITISNKKDKEVLKLILDKHISKIPSMSYKTNKKICQNDL